MQIRPRGDVLPGRARYGDTRSWGIGSNPLHSDEPLWYALPDVITSKLTPGGKAPEIVRATRLVPVGRQRGLKPIKLRGEVEIDPRKHDLFKAAIEERHKLEDKNGPTGRFLKTFANATSYGIYAEMIRRELPAGQRQDVMVYGLSEQPFTASVSASEQPGRFAFPPMSACITAAARLMLATLEALVVEQSGMWAFCDTDSMAIVATETGGLVPCPGGPDRDSEGRECVRALSSSRVDEIVTRFEALNPYDRSLVPGSVLEIEDENYELDPADPERKRVLRNKRGQLHCYSISAKRYALYNLDEHGRPILRKLSEHGLGHLLDPTVRDPDESPIDPTTKARKWIKQFWQHIVETDALGLPSEEPDFLDRPALTRTTITSPPLLKPFDEHNRKRPVAERIRPYNFLLVAHVHEPGFQGIPERFLLVAPYESDSRKWRRLEWTNAYEPDSRYRIVTEEEAKRRSPDGSTPVVFPGEIIVKTYRDVLADYRIHPEAKSLGTDGKPCHRATVGLLFRRPVKTAAIHYIGKESNKIEERESRLVGDLDDALTEYHDPDRDPLWQLVVEVLREPRLTVEQTAAAAGASERTVERARAGKLTGKTARAKTARAKLSDYAAKPACPGPRSRHPAAYRLGGAPRHLPRPADSAGPGASALRMRMRAGNHARTPRPDVQVALRRMPQARRTPARQPRLNPSRPPRARILLDRSPSDCSFSINGAVCTPVETARVRPREQ